MTDKQLENLLERYTTLQSEANCLYKDILIELGNRGLLSERKVISSYHTKEPKEWKELILELIAKDKEGENNG